jgi:hypothetical protein
MTTKKPTGMGEQLDAQAEKRIAENLKSALVEVFTGAKNGTVSHAQRETLARALDQAKTLSEQLLSTTVNEARATAGLS